MKNSYEILDGLALIDIVYHGISFVMKIEKENIYKLEPYSSVRLLHSYKDKNYAVVKFKNEMGIYITLPVHRLITNCPKGMYVDHINHDGLDNRIENLRVVTNSENLKNRKSFQTNNKLKTLNVHYNTHKNRFVVQFSSNSKVIHSKYFKEFLLAKEYAELNRKKYLAISV